MIAFFRRFIPTKKLTKLEWVVVALIVVVLVALLNSQAQWAGSGSRVMPVLVDVFDAASGKPIIGAKVTVMPGSSAYAGFEFRHQFWPEIHESTDDRIQHGVTNETGQVRLEHEFPTSSGPSGVWVSLRRGWVCVTAHDYGAVVVPVRYDSARRETVVKDGKSQDVFVTIGLFPLTQAQLRSNEAKQPMPNE